MKFIRVTPKMGKILLNAKHGSQVIGWPKKKFQQITYQHMLRNIINKIGYKKCCLFTTTFECQTMYEPGMPQLTRIYTTQWN